jgi:indolepyruvate ferredoxin oxidoreductase alpha subunit
MSQRILLGDEAVALGAIHAGMTSAYAYPGTPSTEILQFILTHKKKHGRPHAAWCANEKTAYEGALGTTFVGRRALVAMKHVGLNVAADPFVNSALVEVHGGLVLAIADDPGMHSSQNEQDSRFYADFAHILCLEPGDQQQAYDMTIEAFELSERFRVPVMLRLVTRLAHSRTNVAIGEQREENPLLRAPERTSWILLPAFARRQWHKLLDRQSEMKEWSENTPFNRLELNEDWRELGVITAGLARGYYRENFAELKNKPSHLHIGVYPLPVGKIRELASHVKKILVIEDGFPFIERQLRGLLPTPVEVIGKLTGELPLDGELTPDLVRAALGLPAHEQLGIKDLPLPRRPPQLCKGCPHGYAYKAMIRAFDGLEQSMVTADIGCYTLGALPPYSAIESCVCMGASIGMAKGAADAGFEPAVAVIGDSTFLHSGMTPLLDAATANTNMTLLILDNEVVAMTGGQETLVPSSSLHDIILGLGVNPEHLHTVEATPKKATENTNLLHREFEYKGLSVVIMVREGIQTAKKKRRAQAAEVSA